jgi:hypothetical protein
MVTITDPRRLLNGFTIAVVPFLKCYVGGCYEEASVGRLHQQFGRVDTCASHDPAKHGYARPFGVPAPIAELPTSTIPPLTGGTRVPRRPIQPIIPPAPAALPLPGALRPF